MAAGPGKRSDFVLYEPEFQSGMIERTAQVLNGFNAASANGLRLLTAEEFGQVKKEAFFKSIGDGLVSRRDHTSLSALTPQKLEQGENISIKLDRKYAIENTIDSFRKIGLTTDSDMSDFSFVAGQQVADIKAKEMFNTAVAAVRAVIAKGTTTTTYTVAGAGGLKYGHLERGRRLLGDQAQGLATWAMRYLSYSDLMVGALADAVGAYDALGGVIVQTGRTSTLGLPVVVSDVPALTDDNDSQPTTFDVLGLFPGAVEVTLSERDIVYSAMQGKQEQLTWLIQGEYSFTLKIRGFKWAGDAGDAVNPTTAALTEAAHWTATAADPVKHGPGVMITHQALE